MTEERLVHTPSTRGRGGVGALLAPILLAAALSTPARALPPASSTSW